MIIIGVDFHPEFQQMASVDTDTGEFQEKRLTHREEAEKFYSALMGEKVRVGMEASGHARWFERLLSELRFELNIGDAAEIRTKRVRKQKTDRQDARLILQLLIEDRFPRIWVPSWENRDLRQLLWHRHRMVQARTRIMNQLQAVALNEGLRCKKRLWRDAGREQLESFRLSPWASRRRRDLLELLDRLTPTIAELTAAIEQEVEKCPETQRLQTHPGVGAFANRSEDVCEMRELIGPTATLISKIESRSGIANLEEIARLSDAILIDRGDLSRQVPLEQIPGHQKDIIERVKAVGRLASPRCHQLAGVDGPHACTDPGGNQRHSQHAGRRRRWFGSRG